MERQLDAARVGGPLQRVREQVVDDLKQTIAVGRQDDVVVDDALEVDLATPRLLGQRRVRLLDQL